MSLRTSAFKRADAFLRPLLPGLLVATLVSLPHAQAANLTPFAPHGWAAIGTAAALVFPHVFFPNLDPTMATISSLGTFAVAFASRPIGAAVFGHFGHRLGRKKTLIATLLIMGTSTVGVGLVPSAASIGMAAPAIRDGRLTLDFVVHGDDGVGGPWAAAAAPGDVLVFEGPGGGYRPDPDADWHLMLGDESALPAVAASLEAVPPGRRAVVRMVCDGPAHEIELSCPGDLDLAWLHRTGTEDADLLPRAVAALDFPAGKVHAFVHGEADEVRAVRRHLLAERGLARSDMSCSPYWRRTMTDEAWRRVKRDYVAQMDADVTTDVA